MLVVPCQLTPTLHLNISNIWIYLFLKSLDDTGKTLPDVLLVLNTPRAGIHASDFPLLGGKICSTENTLEL